MLFTGAVLIVADQGADVLARRTEAALPHLGGNEVLHAARQRDGEGCFIHVFPYYQVRLNRKKLCFEKFDSKARDSMQEARRTVPQIRPRAAGC